MVKFIQDEGLDKHVYLIQTKAVDIFMNENAWHSAQRFIEMYTAAGGVWDQISVFGKEDAYKVSTSIAISSSPPSDQEVTSDIVSTVLMDPSRRSL